MIEIIGKRVIEMIGKRVTRMARDADKRHNILAQMKKKKLQAAFSFSGNQFQKHIKINLKWLVIDLSAWQVFWFCFLNSNDLVEDFIINKMRFQ